MSLNNDSAVSSDNPLRAFRSNTWQIQRRLGDCSAFFVTRAQYENLAKLPADKVADVLGLPAEQGIRGAQLGFDVYAMKPKSWRSSTVFKSTVAPIKQGDYRASGGGEQILMPNRSSWTNPNLNKIGEIPGANYGH